MAFLFMPGIFCVKAQYVDYATMYQMQSMYNSMNMNNMVIQGIDQFNRQMEEFAKENKERIERNMNVSACFLPGSETDSYKVLARLSDPGIIDKISILYYFENGDDSDWYTIPVSECTVYGNLVYTPAIFFPGCYLVIMSDAETFVSEKIPEKNLSLYSAFKKKANDNLQALVASYSIPGSTTVYPSSLQSNQHGRTRAQIIADIRKTERLKADAQQNQARDNSISGSVGYGNIISQYDRRLFDLNQELSKAAY
jgi:hypothetical protein